MSAQDEAVAKATTPSYSDSPDPAAWHDRRHEPFEEGNEMSLKSGARSKRVLDRATQIISDDLLQRYPHVAAYSETVEALSRATALTRLLFADISTGGIRGKDGELKNAAMQRYFSAERLAAHLRADLGMTAASEASVARDRAFAVASAASVDLEALANRGRQALEARDGAAVALEQTKEMK
jgi:hypothetical protein